MMTNASRTQRDQFCGKNKPKPFQAISDSLPAQPHCGVSTTKTECLTSSPLMIHPAGLPALPRVSYGRQTFSKLLLLALGFFLLVRLSRLLLWTGTRTCTA